MFEKFTQWASAVLPTIALPKAPKGPVSLPGYRRSLEVSTSKIQQPDRRLASTDRLLDVRDKSSTPRVMKALAKSSPDLSSAINSLLRTGIPERYTLVARDMDGVISPEATALAHELLRRLTYLGNADGSYGAQMSLQTLSETLALDALLYGAMAGEVALDKARVPASLNAVSVTTLKMYEEDNSTRFVQEVAGTEIDLDIPTFVFVPVDQMADDAYPSSYFEGAIQPLMADLDFNNDLRRALKRAVLPRFVASVDSEKVKKFTPPEILADPDKFAAYKEEIILAVETTLNSANPEEAFVGFDYVAYQYVDGGHDPSEIIQRVQGVLNSKLAAGAKTLPVVLGHGSNSNASSTEAMLYVKHANLLRVKLNEFYSRALTVAVRIMGQDAYVEFAYRPIDLRPESELEAFRSMEQSRVLDLLSLGMIPDEEACVQLTGNLPPPTYKPLSGTMFRHAGSSSTSGNPTSNTSAMGQTLKPDTPQAPKTNK